MTVEALTKTSGNANILWSMSRGLGPGGDSSEKYCFDCYYCISDRLNWFLTLRTMIFKGN